LAGKKYYFNVRKKLGNVQITKPLRKCLVSPYHSNCSFSPSSNLDDVLTLTLNPEEEFSMDQETDLHEGLESADSSLYQELEEQVTSQQPVEPSSGQEPVEPSSREKLVQASESQELDESSKSQVRFTIDN
jgi:hypothetical protein